ncbi:MAG: response regulator [Bacteroidia bacterium]
MKKYSTTSRYTLIGSAIGLFFPLLAAIVEIKILGLAINPLNLWVAQKEQPLLWIIDLAPLFLGFLSWMVGKKQDTLSALNDNLENQVVQRTKELIQKNQDLHQEITERVHVEENLIRARLTAENAAKARSEFLSNMSHEIRTPLNAIIGLTGLLSETILEAEQADFVNIVRMSGESLLCIINDILDYSKIESGKMELEEHPFALIDPIEDAFDLLSTKANEKNLELIYEVQDSVPAYISGDITRIRQILVNLVSNAVKFTDSGEIFVHVKSLGKKGDLHILRFAVKDSGIGIPADRVDKLFKSFSQVDASTTRKYGGTGLGLAICNKLVSLMGGEIGVESVEGSGSTFYFTLQVPIAKDVGKGLYFPSQTINEVLIVDDNEANLKILTSRLKKWGLKVSQTNLPLKALSMFSDPHFQPSVVIVDLNMPLMDGVTLAKEIRQIRGDSVNLIMLSSSGNPENQDDRQWFNSWQIKPVRNEQLFNAVFRTVTLPSKEKTNNASPSRPERAVGSLPIRILLAEDNTINQKVALRLLDKIGLRADVASNGAEAVLAASTISYDLILMDMQMPEKDGLEATREIRKNQGETTLQPIIIAMTANVMNEDRVRCMEAGMNDFLSKPVKLSEMEAMIDKWFLDSGKENVAQTISSIAPSTGQISE